MEKNAGVKIGKEEFQLISEEEAAKRRTTSRFESLEYEKYSMIIKLLRDRGGYCHIKTRRHRIIRAETDEFARHMGIALTIEKTQEGIQFRIATEREVRERKKS